MRNQSFSLLELLFAMTVAGLQGTLRKDRNLVPINSDYDLYSLGPDGETRPPLTAGPSRDDIARAADGSFVGSVVGF
jgi:general secretion pathway protein G